MKLEEGEFLVARVKKHWMALVFTLIVGILGSALFLPMIFWMIYKVARYFRDEIVLTNKNFYQNTRRESPLIAVGMKQRKKILQLIASCPIIQKNFR